MRLRATVEVFSNFQFGAQAPYSMRARSRSRVLSSSDEGRVERLLAQLCLSARHRKTQDLASVVCRTAKAFFRIDGASYWQMESEWAQ